MPKRSPVDRARIAHFRELLSRPTCQGARGADCGKPFVSAETPDGEPRLLIVGGGAGLPDWPLCSTCAAPFLRELALRREKVLAQRRAGEHA